MTDIYQKGNELRIRYGSIEYLLKHTTNEVDNDIEPRIAFCIVCKVRTLHKSVCCRCGYKVTPISIINGQ